MNKRKRGRPKGTKIDDSRELARIAALILSEPKLRPTTAIKKLGIHDKSKIHRLLGRWKEQGSELLAQASANRERTRQPTVSSRASGVLGFRSYDGVTSMRLLGLTFPRPNPLEQIASTYAGMSIGQEFKGALGLERSYLEAYEQAKRIAGDLSHSATPNLIDTSVSSVDKLLRLAGPCAAFGRDFRKVMFETDRLVGESLGVYSLAGKYA